MPSPSVWSFLCDHLPAITEGFAQATVLFDQKPLETGLRVMRVASEAIHEKIVTLLLGELLEFANEWQAADNLEAPFWIQSEISPVGSRLHCLLHKRKRGLDADFGNQFDDVIAYRSGSIIMCGHRMILFRWSK
jgi:hypothetical protein